ncbi:MAG: hypothetical protein ABI883_02025 [Chthoniobacterales bacterium]
MDYVICIFLLGLIVSFVVIVGLARAAEFARAESSRHLEIDPVPEDWKLRPEAPAEPR